MLQLCRTQPCERLIRAIFRKAQRIEQLSSRLRSDAKHVLRGHPHAATRGKRYVRALEHKFVPDDRYAPHAHDAHSLLGDPG